MSDEYPIEVAPPVANPERVAIIGSREWGARWPEVKQAIEDYVRALPAGTVVVSGGAIGVDMAAQCAAQRRGLEVACHLPDWKRDGRAAAFVRNGKIEADADRCVAWWNGESSGTMDTVERFKRAGKPCEVRT